MAYRLDPRRQLATSVQEVASSQIDDLMEDLEHPARRGTAGAVHDARKRCKKLRALARLVRPGLGALYPTTNTAFRDAARELSDLRDAQVLVDTLENLVASTPTELEPPDLTDAREEAEGRRRRALDATERRGGPLERARRLAEEGAEITQRWELDDDVAVLTGGLERTYRRVVRARRRCLDTSSPVAFHQWRKRVKYHRHHVDLLRGTAEGLAGPWARRLHDLTDALGDDHDLAELVATVREDPDAFGGPEQVDAIEVLALGRSADLRRRALSLGARVCAEDPAAVVTRLRLWWEATQDHGPSPRRTALADLGAAAG